MLPLTLQYKQAQHQMQQKLFSFQFQSLNLQQFLVDFFKFFSLNILLPIKYKVKLFLQLKLGHFQLYCLTKIIHCLLFMIVFKFFIPLEQQFILINFTTKNSINNFNFSNFFLILITTIINFIINTKIIVEPIICFNFYF